MKVKELIEKLERLNDEQKNKNIAYYAESEGHIYPIDGIETETEDDYILIEEHYYSRNRNNK